MTTSFDERRVTPTMRSVPPGHGLRWAREGLEILSAAPATWLGITVVFILIGVAVSMVPFAGMMWSVAVPMHTGGLMLGCEALRQGRRLHLRHLFAGFEQPHVQPLAILGALYLAGTIAVFIPAVAVAVIGMMSAMTVGAVSSGPGTALAFAVVGLVMLLVVVASFALAMAVWFAPALVVFDRLTAIDAMKASFHAAWRNILPFLVYVAALLGVGLIAAAPLIAAITLVAANREQDSRLVIVLIGGTGLFTLSCMFLLMPAAWGAMYASYRDVFHE